MGRERQKVWQLHISQGVWSEGMAASAPCWSAHAATSRTHLPHTPLPPPAHTVFLTACVHVSALLPLPPCAPPGSWVRTWSSWTRATCWW